MHGVVLNEDGPDDTGESVDGHQDGLTSLDGLDYLRMHTPHHTEEGSSAFLSVSYYRTRHVLLPFLIVSYLPTG